MSDQSRSTWGELSSIPGRCFAMFVEFHPTAVEIGLNTVDDWPNVAEIGRGAPNQNNVNVARL